MQPFIGKQFGTTVVKTWVVVEVLVRVENVVRVNVGAVVCLGGHFPWRSGTWTMDWGRIEGRLTVAGITLVYTVSTTVVTGVGSGETKHEHPLLSWYGANVLRYGGTKTDLAFIGAG